MKDKDKQAVCPETDPLAYVPADDDFTIDTEQDITTDRNYASQGFWKGVFTRFFKNARAVIGLVIIVLIIIIL